MNVDLKEIWPSLKDFRKNDENGGKDNKNTNIFSVMKQFYVIL